LRILFDQGVPQPLRNALVAAEVKTAFEMGWSKLENGFLIDSAEESGFDVFISTDKNLRYQQDLSARKIAIVILPTTSWPKLQPFKDDIGSQVSQITPGSYIEISFDSPT